MVARIEPPRSRPTPKEPGTNAARYPGLTAEERGLDLDPPESSPRDLEPPPPLWIAPVEVPRASRSVGFAAAYPDTLPDDLLVKPLEPEGLFDVPGLLERLWLARALESHRDPPATAPIPREAVPAPTVPPAFRTVGSVPSHGTPALATPPADPRPVGDPRLPFVPTPGSRVEDGRTPSRAFAPAPPSGWICPQCYLTNDAGSESCRACRWRAPLR